MTVIRRIAGTNPKRRILVGGLTSQGKTTSLCTFVYGPHNPVTHPEDAASYAGEKQGIILICPGETGELSLPKPTSHLVAYALDDDTGESHITGKKSREYLDEFYEMIEDSTKEKPYVLMLDGVHILYEHMINEISNGQFLQGDDMNYENGSKVEWRAANIYSRAHKRF